MGDKQDFTSSSPLMEEGNSTGALVAYVQSQQRKRTLRDVTIVVSCFAILAWCGYLTLSVKDGTFDMRMAEMEIKRIEDVVNDVVAAIPAEKNPEVITANVHIQEHGVNYQQSITYDPWTQIARIHNPHHLDLDETITLMHKPSGMMLMLNNNHKHCEYSAMPEGMDPEGFAKASKEAEEEHQTLSMDLPQTGETLEGTVLGDTLTEEEREDLHSEMQTLCAGLDIFHIKKIKLPAGSINNTEWEVPSQDKFEDLGRGGRMKRASQGSISCGGGHELVDKCYPYQTGWGHSCMWIVCSRRLVDTGVCLRFYNHVGSQTLACLRCCKEAASSTLCQCSRIHDKSSFTRCQYQMECHLGQPHRTGYC